MSSQPPYGSDPSRDSSQDGQPQYGSQPGYGGQPQYGSQPGGQVPSYSAAGGYPGGEVGPSASYPGYGSQPDPHAGYGGRSAPYAGGDGKSRNLFGVLALIAGILAFLTSGGVWIPIIGLVIGAIAFLLAIGAAVLGIMGLSAARQNKATNRGMSIAGIVLGGLSLLGTIMLSVVQMFLFNSLPEPDADRTDEQTESATRDPGHSDEDDPTGDDDPADGSTRAAGGQSLGSAELTSAVRLTVSAEPDTVDFGAGEAADEIARVVYTIDNASGSDFDPGFPLITCTYAGGTCDDVFSGGYSGGLAFDTVPAGQKREFALGYAVPHSEIDSLKLEVIILSSDDPLTPYEFEKK